MRRSGPMRIGALALVTVVSTAFSASYDPKLFSEMRWRGVGPLRGGRTRATAGIPSQPNVFYIGVVNGGVWKTNDFGRTWNPIFDDQPTGSVGAIAIAPSDPNIVYVGSGEGLQRPDLSVGDGIYKSTDAGKTWTHLGLRDGQQIPQMVVDPRDPNKLFVGPGPSIRTKRRARHLSIDRRRSIVQEGFVQGRKHRRLRRRAGSDEPERRVRLHVGRPSRALGKRGVGRHEWRDFQIDRRRKHMETTDPWPPSRGRGPSERRDRGKQSAAHLRHCRVRIGP